MAEHKRHQGHRQRMRERVQNYGLDSLAEHEALEYVLYLTNAQKDTNGIAHDLIDRFGDIPKKVQQLLVIASLKSLAHSVYVTAIEQKGEEFDLQCMKKQRSIHPVFLNFWIVIKRSDIQGRRTAVFSVLQKRQNKKAIQKMYWIQ